jgi:hypothetical protein
MRRLLVALFALGIAAEPCAAATFKRSTAMEARAAIDAVCDVYNARPNLIRRVQMARVHQAASAGIWKTSTDDALAKLQSSGNLSADFADVFSRDDKIVYAIFTRGDATGDGGGADEYCYINQKLARASTELVDTSTDHEVSRKLYFDARGGLFADTGAMIRDIDKRRNATVPEAYTAPLDIPVYATPAKLPFYGAYRAALVGKLPAL